MTPEDRNKQTKEKILKAGLKLWLENPDHVTANRIAGRIKMTHGTVLYHFPEGVKDSVAEYALRTGNSRIIAQLIATGHPIVDNLSPTERVKHLTFVSQA